MTLPQWAKNGWLRPHSTSAQEIGNLLAVVDRDLADAAADISADGRFGIAYSASLRLCTVLLYASGYRAEKNLQHYRTIQALPLILGPSRTQDAEYLETCRRRRNKLEYDAIGGATVGDADELAAFSRQLRDDVLTWLREHHPELA